MKQMKKVVTYVFLEPLLVEIRLALDFAGVVRSALRVLVHLEGSFSTLGHVCAHEGSCVLLELRTLRLNFKLIIAVESCGIFLVHA